MKFFTLRNFHGYISIYKWGFSSHLIYLNTTKKPLPKYTKLIYFFSIGIGYFGDLRRSIKYFHFAFDILNFKQVEGNPVRINFSIPLTKHETIRNVESV